MREYETPEKQEPAVMPLICLRCKKSIPLTTATFHEIGYTKYSYCEECLHAGIKALKETPEGTRPLPRETPENSAGVARYLAGIMSELVEIKKAIKGES